ncbi:MAG: hypothetical protein E7394_02225 [Ruminococcaceae bacterium]|nr:hypothetical protein [Oscillospiraceae bacterium]
MIKRNPMVILISIMCLIVLTAVFISFYDTNIDESYNVVNNSKDRMSEFKGVIKLKGRYKEEFEERIVYNDAWFTQDSNIYNHNLATSSLYVALSTFSDGDYSKYWGEKIDNIREKNIESVLSNLSFKNAEFKGYSTSLNSSESKVAFGMAMKSFYVDDLPYNVVCVAIRSGGYGCEWSDNFNVGNEDMEYHKGFYDSALGVKKALDDYVKRNCNKGNVKFWICGYSRGGAVANILATMIDDKSNVYAYTFASPNTFCFDDQKMNSYDNIFNIINPYDPVVSLPPAEWGFSKAGRNMYFPQNYEKTDEIITNVYENYYNLTGENDDIYTHSLISDLMDYIISFVDTRKNYSDNYQNVFQALAKATLTRTKVLGKWEKIPFETYIKNTFGKDGSIAIKNFEKSEHYNSMESVGLSVPELIRQLDIALRIYGHESPEKLLFENMTLDSIDYINKMKDNSSFKSLAVGHYPEVYISWMKSIKYENFVEK